MGVKKHNIVQTAVRRHKHTDTHSEDTHTGHNTVQCTREVSKLGTLINPNIHPREYPSLRPSPGNGKR